LRSKGIVVRDRNPFLRMSVGTKEENDCLLAAFKEIGETLCEK